MADAPDALPFLQLVADPVRWQILVELGASDRRVGELVALTGKPQNVVSYHLRELRSAGLVTSRQSAADGRDTYYRADVLRCGQLFDAARGALYPGLGVAETSVAPPGGRRPHRVLFLCTGNSARSQMAEALVEHRSSGHVEARSAGSAPKPLHPNAVAVMAERGIDIGERRSKHLDRFVRNRFDRVVTMCDKVREICPQFPGDPVASHWSMADPASSGETPAATLAAFERAANEIEVRVGLLLGHILNERSSRA